MISIKDIARAMGVSTSSVSLVLNGKAREKRISENLETRIIEMANKMGYSPNRVAVGLRTGKSKTIGLIVEDISNNFFSSLAKVIEDEVRKFGYNVVYCSTENDIKKSKEVIQMLFNQQVEGYLITPSYGMEIDIERLLKQKKPVVFMDRGLEGIGVPCVLVDNYSGMKEGMEHILKAGYKNIGFITVNLDLVQMKERERAYKETILLHHLQVKSKNILKLKYNDPAEKSVAAISKFIKDQKDMEVIFCATNYIGIYVLQSLRELNLHIPNDVKMICFDDHDVFELYSPGITVIEQPIKEIARSAVHILMGELGQTKPDAKKNVLISAKIVIRGST